jgi:heme/copper-type cytochrome/quinol oxidase subunit 2
LVKESLRVVPWVLLAGLARSGAGAFAVEVKEKKRFEVTASRYAFSPARIEVKEGDVVELALRSADTDHGLAIKAYALKVAIPKGGETVGVSFVASRPGIFPIECSEYCGSGHKRMRGELVVAERAQ